MGLRLRHAALPAGRAARDNRKPRLPDRGAHGMSIREVISLINQMVTDGVIDRYAIGGAVGATFYLEPVAPLDVHVFVAFRAEPGQLLASPKPIFDYLASHGCSMKGEYVMI